MEIDPNFEGLKNPTPLFKFSTSYSYLDNLERITSIRVDSSDTRFVVEGDDGAIGTIFLVSTMRQALGTIRARTYDLANHIPGAIN